MITIKQFERGSLVRWIGKVKVTQTVKEGAVVVLAFYFGGYTYVSRAALDVALLRFKTLLGRKGVELPVDQSEPICEENA